jgi:hypothetical protein
MDLNSILKSKKQIKDYQNAIVSLKETYKELFGEEYDKQ